MLKSLSLEERATAVRRAFARVSDTTGVYLWVVDVYDDHVIVSSDQSDYWRAGFTIDGTTVTVAEREAWTKVEKEWIEAKGIIFASHGSAVEVKSADEGYIAGYLVTYGDATTSDLTPFRDFFTKNTDYDLEAGEEKKVSVYFNHGYDPVLKSARLGRGTIKQDDVGVWIDAWLDVRGQYEKHVAALLDQAKNGKLGWSSGAPPHLVERARVGDAHEIKKWSLGSDATITFIPADWRSSATTAIKSLIHAEDSAISSTDAAQSEAQGAQPEAAAAAGGAAQDGGATKAEISFATKTEGEMPELEERLTGLESTMKTVGDSLDKVLKYMEDAPAIKNAGYFSVDGGAADPAVKSFGDWLKAVMRGDERRLQTVYGSTKATMDTQTGALGGYAVPEAYRTDLLKLAEQKSAIVARVNKIPVTEPSGKFPTLNVWDAPTAGVGQTAAAAKVTTAKRAEGAAYTETNLELEEIRYNINDAASGLLKLTKELRADSVVAIEAFLRLAIANAVAAKQEYYILRGSGIGEPLGILNAPALINISPDTNNTFAYADAVEMITRFKSPGGAPAWVGHSGMLNDIAQFQVGGTGSSVVFAGDLTKGLGGVLLGYPLLFSEHAPQPDNSGCIGLYDLGAYLIFQKGEMYIEFSDQRYFDEGKDAWRFGIRMDGQPWWKAAQTQADPQGSFTQSPYVNFND